MRDFRHYGLMETGNIVAIPAFALFLAIPQNRYEWMVMALAVLACASFLAIGAIFWLALDNHIEKRDEIVMRRALELADRAEKPCLLLTICAAICALFVVSLLRSTPALIAALFLVILALLEYVNYYHFQLMNFDNPSDFRRLVRTRKLRRAHLSRKLRAYRQLRAD